MGMMAQTKLKRRGIGLEFGHTYRNLWRPNMLRKKRTDGIFFMILYKNAKSRVLGPFFAFGGCI